MASLPLSSSSTPSTSSAPELLENLPNWVELPQEVTAAILHRLGAIDILEVAQKVCRTWRRVCKDPSMWRSIDMFNRGVLHEMPYDLERMCIHAIDRSCGQLNDINIEYFGTDELLQYIADRAPQLRKLRIACCYGSFSEEVFSEAAKKLPNLEELHMFLTYVSTESLGSVGSFCPQLKSVTYNIQGSRVPYMEDEGDGDALTIAKTMPGLRHLSLFGNQMTNDGLQAILNSCPHLESLDLRQCFNVNLSSPLGRTCAQRIKNLRCPNDSTDDYEFDATVNEGYDYHSYDDEYPSGFSEIEFLSDADDDYAFSGGSELSDDYGGLFI